MKTLFITLMTIVALAIALWIVVKTYVTIHSIATLGIFFSVLILEGSQYG